MTATIWSFDKNGKYLRHLNKKELGPEEYPGIDNVVVDQSDGSIYIYSPGVDAIYKYTNQGAFVDKLKCPYVSGSFEVIGQDTLLCYGARYSNDVFYHATFPEQYRFAVLKDGKEVKKGLKWTFDRNATRIPCAYNNFFRYRDTLLLRECLNNRVYSIDQNNELKPRYRFVFSTNINEFSYDAKEIDPNAFIGKEYISLYDFCETDLYIFIVYSYQEYYCMSVINKKTNNVYNVGNVWYDSKNNVGIGINLNAIDADQKYMYKALEAYQIKNISNKANKEFKEFANSLDETANPVIIKYKLKHEI